MDRLDQIGHIFAEECQGRGLVGFAMRTTESGNVRFIGLSLPPKLIAQLLRTAADEYEKQVRPETVN